jgi:L-alanine-DL-glutamate epimerase-like enolase superfamily enzyme
MTVREGTPVTGGVGTVPEARGMRIASVETVLLSYAFPEGGGLVWSGGTLPGFTAGLVRLTTDDGLVGVGESYAGFFAPEVMSAIVDFYRPMLVGQDPSDIGALWQSCYTRSLYWGRTGINVSVLSAIESALWDLCGKAAGVPVHQLLGGAQHDSIRMYASGGMDQTDEELTVEQKLHVAQGYTASKIRIGHGADRDEHKVRVAREALGPGIALAADAVQGSNPAPWDAETAIEVGKRLEKYDLIWLEEPCAADDVEAHRAVRAAVNIPIAGGETSTTAQQIIDLIEQDCFGIAQPDATHIGGLLEVLRVAEVAAKREVPLAMHVWGCGIGMMANYHAGFASPTCEWLEHPAVGNPLRDALLAEPLTLVDGKILLPTAPGLGVSLTEEVEQQFAYVPGTRYRFGEGRR